MAPGESLPRPEVGDILAVIRMFPALELGPWSRQEDLAVLIDYR